MNPKEQEIAIGELEERVDRLRNLYEQYFLGFEKLEPSVSRKDVDRRFMLLRKEQIRNTAMRFRFNVVTQKFNTYAMHWVRICRQIEDGTYKRHIRKAKARFGDTAEARPEREYSIDVEMGDFDDMDVDQVLAEADAAAATVTRDAPDTLPPPAPAPSQPARVVPDRTAELARQLYIETPETFTPIEPAAAAAIRAPERQARGAALPAGSKPRILRKRGEGSEPPAPASGKTLPGSSPQLQPSSNPRASSPQIQPSSSPRLPAPSDPGIGVPQARPLGPRLVPLGTRANALANAAGAQASGRIPAAAPAPGTASAGRMPVAAASSAGRMPIALPSAPSGPSDPEPRAPAPSGRLPVPPPAPSERRLPLPPPPGSRSEQARPPVPGPAVRPPMPSVSDGGPTSVGARPRAPLPLPSQIARETTKKE